MLASSLFPVRVANALCNVSISRQYFFDTNYFHLTAIDWLRQEELQEVPPKNGYFQIDGWI